MSGDQSLDEFRGGDADGDTERDDAESAEPATPTMRRAPDGAACEACGETVERRWLDGGAFVCAECKEW